MSDKHCNKFINLSEFPYKDTEEGQKLGTVSTISQKLVINVSFQDRRVHESYPDENNTLVALLYFDTMKKC